MRFLIPCLTAIALALPAPAPGVLGVAVPLLIAASADHAEAGGQFKQGKQGRQGGRGGHGKKARSKGKHNVSRNAHGGARQERRRDDDRRDHDRRDHDRDRGDRDRYYDRGRHYDRDDWRHHHHHRDGDDFVTGLAAGVAAAVVIGAVVSSLPSGCASQEIRGVAYRRCGNDWYRPQYSGGDVTYVVVVDPR